MIKNFSYKEQYNKWWDDVISSNAEDPGTIYRANLILENIKYLRPKSIIDCGCGSGELIKKIIAITQKKIKLAGFDIADHVIEMNKQKYPSVIFFSLNLNNKIKLKQEFDLAICSEVIEHVNNWKNVIYNLNRMIRQGGCLIVTTQAGERYKHHKTLGHIRHFKKEEIEKELLKYNIRTIKSYYSGWPFMNLKNELTNIFYSRIEKNLLKSKEQSLFNKIIFKLFKFLYDISLKTKGPQIFILACKG